MLRSIVKKNVIKDKSKIFSSVLIWKVGKYIIFLEIVNNNQGLAAAHQPVVSKSLNDVLYL